MSVFKGAVLGYPAVHSKSPVIHEYWIKQYGLEGTYDAIDVQPQDLNSTFKNLCADGYTGFSITLPHKDGIQNLCDEIDISAQAIGAVNCIHVQGGKVHGYNTDGFGAIENIRTQYSDFEMKGKTAVILGAGGATRAIAYALLQEGMSVIIVNRTYKNAKKIADDMRMYGAIEAYEWCTRHEILERANMLINTTPLGMAGFAPLDISLKDLPISALVYDIVYKPLMTPFLYDAQTRGHKIVTGIGMLLHQARPAFLHWFGVMPDVDDTLERLVLE